MTPQEKEKMAQLEAQVTVLMQYMNARKVQQISYPLDDASKTSLGVPIGEGPGSTALTENRSLTGNVQTISVPKAYVQTVLVRIDGASYELPSLI